jgi:hypothetical protein
MPFGEQAGIVLWLADGIPAPAAAGLVSLDCACSLEFRGVATCRAARVAITPYRLRKVPVKKGKRIDSVPRKVIVAGHRNAARIYLFGSEARGEAGPDSDLDFFVVASNDAPER